MWVWKPNFQRFCCAASQIYAKLPAIIFHFWLLCMIVKFRLIVGMHKAQELNWLTLGARGFLREEPRSSKKKKKRERYIFHRFELPPMHIFESYVSPEIWQFYQFVPALSTIMHSIAKSVVFNMWENLWLPGTVDWSYHANRFELGSRSDPASWLVWRNLIAYSDWLSLTDKCVVIGCLLINLIMLLDTYRSMIVRFASPATRGLLLPLLSLSCLFTSKENLWGQGTHNSLLQKACLRIDNWRT